MRGALVATDVSAPFSASFNSAAVADGLRRASRATAYDAAGNSSFNSVQSSRRSTPRVVTGPDRDGQTYGGST